MERRPVLLDLFCKAGGAARGYADAGFEVIGVDIEPQRHYPYTFVQGDALNPPFDLSKFDAIHASPVCKRFSKVTKTRVNPEIHPDQIAPIRALLETSGRPYVIENVPEAPLIDPITLCGSMFDLDVQRHRVFEANWPLAEHHWPCRHKIWAPRFTPARSTGRPGRGKVVTVAGRGGWGVGQYAEDWRRAMQIDWMTVDELAQAIPPAYTEFIGRQWINHLTNIGAAA